MSDRLERVRLLLAKHDQAHLLTFYGELDEDAQSSLLSQVEMIDFALMDDLIKREVLEPGTEDQEQFASQLEPAPFHYFQSKEESEAFRGVGEALLNAGQVAAFTVAGGQGTRLGWTGPKGTFPGTPVTGKSLFQSFAEQILASQRRYGCRIPWYIMTSRQNDDATRSFFLDNNCFGLVRSEIYMFPQGEIPSVDATTGKILLAEKGRIAMNPDGHGGSLRALCASGAIEDMQARGIQHISYFQVDNPLVRVLDPVFIGVHASADDSSAQMTSKMVSKIGPEERVGVFCKDHGKTKVIEYSNLPTELAHEKDSSGQLKFKAGSIAVHILGVPFIEQLGQPAAESESGVQLPWHRAHKKVSAVDLSTGTVIEPSEPNAVKFETFVFDALQFADQSAIMETSREEEFAPIKNREGTDSAVTSYLSQTVRAANWLSELGTEIPRKDEGGVSEVDAVIEISPLTAMDVEELSLSALPDRIASGERVVL